MHCWPIGSKCDFLQTHTHTQKKKKRGTVTGHSSVLSGLAQQAYEASVKFDPRTTR